MYEKAKRSDADFIAIGLLLMKEKLIKRINKKDSPKEKDQGESKEKEWKIECLGTKPQPDQAEPIEDINLNMRRFKMCVQLVMDKYQDEMPEGFERVLWGDLMVLFKPDEQDEFCNSQHKWKVHTLMTEEELVIHMLIEKKYPLKKEIVVQMLKLKLESEEESYYGIRKLIKIDQKVNHSHCFLGKELASPDQTVLGYRLLKSVDIADSLLKNYMTGYSIAPCYENEALASPKANGICYERPHKGVKASANSDIMYFFTSAQDGDPLQDDVRLCLGDDLKKAQDHNQRQVKDESKDHYPKCTRYQMSTS
ncbi:hypothetical protein Tco_0185591 [Tanacetum coccineum]